MLINIDCIPCLLKMAKSIIGRLPLSEPAAKQLYEEILEIPALKGKNWNITSGQVIEQIMLIVTEAAGKIDPFQKEKESQNKLVMDLYPGLKKQLDVAEDPLLEAVKLAILGNSIDFMTMNGSPEIKSTIAEKNSEPLDKAQYDRFHKKLKTSKRILYLGDNAGEIVLDKLLIEILVKEYGLEVIFVVRSFPTLNDVILEDARYVGMDRIAALYENGVDGPLAGTILNRMSVGMKNEMERADLIISKGGANFETLHEEYKKINTDISFMLVSKCKNYIDLFKVPVGDPVLYNFNKG